MTTPWWWLDLQRFPLSASGSQAPTDWFGQMGQLTPPFDPLAWAQEALAPEADDTPFQADLKRAGKFILNWPTNFGKAYYDVIGEPFRNFVDNWLIAPTGQFISDAKGYFTGQPIIPEIQEPTRRQPVPQDLPMTSPSMGLQIPDFTMGPAYQPPPPPIQGMPDYEPLPYPPAIPYPPNRPAPTKPDLDPYMEAIARTRPLMPDSEEMQRDLRWNILAGLAAGMSGAENFSDLLLGAGAGGSAGVAAGRRQARQIERQHEAAMQDFERTRAAAELQRAMTDARYADALSEADYLNMLGRYNTDVQNQQGRYRTDVANIQSRNQRAAQASQVDFANQLRQWEYDVRMGQEAQPKIRSVANGLVMVETTENGKRVLKTFADPMEQLLSLRAISGGKSPLRSGVARNNPLFQAYAALEEIENMGLLPQVIESEVLEQAANEAMEMVNRTGGAMMPEAERAKLFRRYYYGALAQLFFHKDLGPVLQERVKSVLGGTIPQMEGEVDE